MVWQPEVDGNSGSMAVPQPGAFSGAFCVVKD